MSIKWNKKGFEAILCSEGASAVCRDHADRICNSAASKSSGQFETNVEVRFLFRSRRICASVRAMDHQAVQDEIENKVLSGSIQ